MSYGAKLTTFALLSIVRVSVANAPLAEGIEMAFQEIFSESFVDEGDDIRVQFACSVDDLSSEKGDNLIITFRGEVFRPSEDGMIEEFECTVFARFENPITLSVITSALLPYGACVVLRVVGALMEAANDGYEATKLKAKNGWRSSGETAAAVADNIVGQAAKLRGKVLSSFVVCIPLTGIYSAIA